jgi:transposase-like protein
MEGLRVNVWTMLAGEGCLSAIRAFVRRFSTDKSCREYLEARLWPNGPVCPHCPGGKKIYRIRGRSARKGLYACGACRRQFTVTIGTILERSHIPLPIWFLGILVVCMCPDTISVCDLQKVVGITYESAHSMHHKIRCAIRRGAPDDITKCPISRVVGSPHSMTMPATEQSAAAPCQHSTKTKKLSALQTQSVCRSSASSRRCHCRFSLKLNTPGVTS